eukprot:5407028-Prymnesium_polylepis.1
MPEGGCFQELCAWRHHAWPPLAQLVVSQTRVAHLVLVWVGLLSGKINLGLLSGLLSSTNPWRNREWDPRMRRARVFRTALAPCAEKSEP